MRNDVKLGLAVGGLLLGVVLAYALFFSNTKDRDRDSLASKIGATDDQHPPAPSNLDPPTNNNHTDPQPPIVTPNIPDHTQPPPADTANPLASRTWTALLNEGAVNGNIGPTIITPRDPVNTNITTPRDPTTLEPTRPTGPRKYTIKPGDNFWTLAKSEYGNGAYFGHIQRANPTIDPQRLKANTIINLPDKNEVIAAATARDPIAPVASTESAIDPSKQYKVQTGDNLSNISKKLYGRFDKWTAIYKFNEELIGPNPAVLKKDMILRLPDPPLTPIAGTTIQ
jgi:nucleoid-associated protein YgaU